MDLAYFLLYNKSIMKERLKSMAKKLEDMLSLEELEQIIIWYSQENVSLR